MTPTVEQVWRDEWGRVLALLVAPLHSLSAGVATLLWTLLLLGAVAAALWLLGVRDWRCYALTAIFPFTRSAVGLGTVEPLLLLAVAVTWRWRDHIVPPALALLACRSEPDLVPRAWMAGGLGIARELSC